MNGLASLLRTAPDGAAATLQAFALAESLTDRTAETLYAIVPLRGLPFADFISALRFSDVVEPRNSEWSFSPAARAALIEGTSLSHEQVESVHRALLEAALREDRGQSGIDTPSYLFTDAGLAYHYAALGEIDTSLRHYGRAARGPYNGAQWLASEFAAEQERRRVIPSGTIEATFLRAMVLFRTGRRATAMPLLAQVAAQDEVRWEVGIALHLVGDDQARRRDRGAERSYRRSIEINEELRNWLSLSHVLHSTANRYAREHRYDEAEALYLRSMDLRELPEVNDRPGLAQTATSLGNMYARQKRFAEAEAAFERSIVIDQDLNNRFGVAKTENSLANLYVREQRYAEAEQAFGRSISIGESIGETKHVALTEHNLANLYSDQGRFEDADGLLRKSRATLKSIRDDYGVAVTGLSLANLYARQHRFDEAESLYRELIEIGEKSPYRDHLARVLLDYGRLIGDRHPDQALDLFDRSLRIDQELGNRRGVMIVRRAIDSLQRRILNQRPK